ncbi:MAG TPA: glycine cleavage T C-terminal barrel domain-containing protein, partial [Pyrinomonadaceae bacterium]|nr:glycine cleavage T C-terminal barrel domain-containing protein [Pyrinomonadaceae bacterium]
VAKKITGITFDQRVDVQNGAKIISVDGKEIGRITSATFSPALNQTIALGYVKYDHLAPGTELVISGVNGIVADLPFVRGSWYEDSPSP